MPVRDLKTFDPELLLQELRARERKEVDERELVKALPCGCLPSAKLGSGGIIESVSDLESFDTNEIATVLRQQQKVIYGTDDRDDMFEITDRRIINDADSVVALIESTSITDNGDGTSTLNGQTFGTRYNLCQTEPFRDQPVVAFCSGFLVDPSIIATAAHCVDTNNLNSVRFVFGFQMRNATTAETRIDNDEIYRGIRILGRQMGIAGTDWALIQIDRPVLNHRYVQIRRSGKIADNSAVHVIGHPCGLPKKHAGNARVRDNTNARYFVANLDTYGGNSGSPVFNNLSHEVEGILVRGETDFVRNGPCNVSNICPANGCDGEDCTRTTEFATLVPRNQHDFIPFDPKKAKVSKLNGRWKIIVDNMLLLDFGSSKKEADQALSIIKFYSLNSQCFVGRPYPSMEFYLVNGRSPHGAMTGEDAIGFNPANLEVQRIRGRWKIVEGNHWLMDFDQYEVEARQSLSYILRYGFRFICFVGRPDPSMTYFRN